MTETPPMDEPKPSAPAGPKALLSSLEKAVQRLKEEADLRKDAARRLGKLAKDSLIRSPKRLEKALAKARDGLPPEAARKLGVEEILLSLDRYRTHYQEALRKELGRSLQEACRAEGLELIVVSREEPVEVRVPPVSVTPDFKKAKATVSFARDPLASCPLDAERILKARRTVVNSLERPFDPAQFFRACFDAYRRILLLEGLPEGERVELVRFLPELAFLLQGKKFKENPRKETFRSYGKAHFAYDVHRLRKAGGLVQGGWRINFGVATGRTATKKGRVIYMEDPSGRGEYKLTVFFTKV